MRLPSSTLLFPLFPLLLSTVSAHGRITNVTTSNGTVYQGWDPATPQAQIHDLAAWRAANLGNIFVTPPDFSMSAITCHYNATPGALHVPTTPGDVLKVQWNEWPASHKGPVLTYLATCLGSCAEVDKNTLEWVKIDEMGWLNSSGADAIPLGGTWATDVLRANGASWMVKVPEALSEGNYVLRHEIMALHVAEALNGAQAYPQCVNLKVAGSGADGAQKLEGGIVGQKLYGMRDKGVLVNIHGNVTEYDIPGPKVWEYATKMRQPGQ